MASETQARAGLAEEIVRKMRDAMQAGRIDALVPMSPDNLAYTAGTVPPSLKTVRLRLAACIIPQEGDTEAVVVGLEGPLMATQSRMGMTTTYREFAENAVDKVAASLVQRGLDAGRIGIEETYLPVAFYRALEDSLPEADLVAADGLLSEIRSLKSGREIELIRDIGTAAQRIAEDCAARVATGATEQDLGSLIAEDYAAAGGDELTMLVVGSGERSAHPNAPPTEKVMAPGEIVRLDVIGTKKNYYSDVARTAVVGEPTSEQQKIYDLLMQVHEQSLEALRPGVQTSDVYRIYKNAMERAGLPPYHFVGHGLGVTLHEEPFINEFKSVQIQENMVLCIEPLTMLEGRFGMQIEDEVIITSDGYEPITRAGAMLRIDG
ncbi:MAG: Xaa-Pro peptidase family protein [Actinomycetota bacterium]|nr:Xaa-Pro peptidase family protein [Actinomycetota bacterium]